MSLALGADIQSESESGIDQSSESEEQSPMMRGCMDESPLTKMTSTQRIIAGVLARTITMNEHDVKM
jgi:hypothetical protein